MHETEENQNTKRKTELDVNLIHSYIASEAGGLQIDRREWKNCGHLNSIHI